MILFLFFFFFSLKIGFVIPCKLSPQETICMKCQIGGDNLHGMTKPVFWGNISKCRLPNELVNLPFLAKLSALFVSYPTVFKEVWPRWLRFFEDKSCKYWLERTDWPRHKHLHTEYHRSYKSTFSGMYTKQNSENQTVWSTLDNCSYQKTNSKT